MCFNRISIGFNRSQINCLVTNQLISDRDRLKPVETSEVSGSIHFDRITKIGRKNMQKYPTLCAHYARACTARIIYIIYARSHILGQTLSKLLRVTESCMCYLIFTCTIACARYAHASTYMCVCVHSHIFGCIRSKFGGDIPLHGLHDFYTCVCTLYAHYARTISSFLDGFFSNLVEHSTGYRDMHGLLDFYMHDCVCALSAYVHFGTDSLQTW
jgi:hypothetical protein